MIKLILAAVVSVALQGDASTQKSATQKDAVQKSAATCDACCCCECSPIVIRTFERKAEDDARRANYKDYCKKLDAAWKAYRDAGSTPEAFAEYKKVAAEAKRDYVTADPYLAPIYQ